MRSKFNELTRLWEQVSDDVLPQDIDNTNAQDDMVVTPQNIGGPTGGNTGKLHGFIIDSNNIDGINQVIQSKVKEWKSETPLKVLGKDGTIGADAMLNGKPLYLMIRVANKAERASTELQLELSDRIYLLLNTSPTELSNIVRNVEGIDSRINVSVKAPNGIEHTVSIWKNDSSVQLDNTDTTNDATLNTDSASVNVDMQAQIDNPGTAAGISGTIQENRKIKNMKTNKVNEQAPFNIADNTLVNNPFKLDTPNYLQSAKPLSAKPLSTEQQALVKNLGAKAKTQELKDGSQLVSLKLTKEGTGIDATAYFYANDGMYIKTKAGGEVLLRATYKNGGKTITPKGKSAVTSGSVYGNLQTVVKSLNKPITTKTTTNIPAVFKTQEEGDAFRAWANSTPELTAKYGKTSKYDLDVKGKFNNSFINKAATAAKDEYAKYKETSKDAPIVDSKYKEGDIVYYKITPTGEVKAVSTGINKEEVDKQKSDMEKAKGNEELYKTTTFGANPKISEAIVTNFNTFKSITEQDELESEDIDAQAGLIKDYKEGNIKKGRVIKQVDAENIKVLDLNSEKEVTIKLSNLVDSAKVDNVKSKIEADKIADENAKAEAKKSDVTGAKDELKSARDEKRGIKQKIKDTKKTTKINTKIDKISKKTEDIKKKSSVLNTSESVVYNFDEFIKKINKLN